MTCDFSGEMFDYAAFDVCMETVEGGAIHDSLNHVASIDRYPKR